MVVCSVWGRAIAHKTVPRSQNLQTLQPASIDNHIDITQVGPDQLPSLHRSMLEAAAILGVEAPELYVRQVSSFEIAKGIL